MNDLAFTYNMADDDREIAEILQDVMNGLPSKNGTVIIQNFHLTINAPSGGGATTVGGNHIEVRSDHTEVTR